MKSFMTKYGGLKFLAILAFVLAACGIVVAENADKKADKKEVLTPLQQQMQKTISVTFADTPIDDVIRAIAEKANVDIIKSPKVIGNVTATLTDVPLGEALDNILAAHGYGYVADKNVIRIAPVAELAQKAESLVSRIYRITYADVKDVESTLQKFISKRGSLSASSSTSNIIVIDTEDRIKAMDTFIMEIDRITPQILVEVRIYDVTTDESFDLGIEWNVGRNSTENDGVTVPDSTSFGVGMSTPSDASGPRDTRTRTSTPFTAGSFDEKTGGSIRLGFLNDAVDIDIALNILHKQAFAKLLANPRIMVLDNETALFDIVREIPYVETTVVSGGGATQTVRFKPVGVKLEVTPHVTRDGMLRMHIVPEFGVHVKDTDPPTVDTRKVDTKTLVKDNQTVVLGGLRKKETTQNAWKVPILGDIPLLGGLFQSETESVLTSELLIFITPRIIIQPTLSPLERKQLEDTTIQSPKDPTLRLD